MTKCWMKNKTTYLLLLGMVMAMAARGQTADIQSLYIHSFIRYIEWPVEARSGDFVIGVLGGGEIMASLQEMAAKKKVGSRSIVIKKIKSVVDINKMAYHVLFIPQNQKNSLARVLTVLGPSPTLVITDAAGSAQKGSGINFVIKNKKLAFELNKKAVDYHRLKVANELSRLAIKI